MPAALRVFPATCHVSLGPDRALQLAFFVPWTQVDNIEINGLPYGKTYWGACVSTLLMSTS